MVMRYNFLVIFVCIFVKLLNGQQECLSRNGVTICCIQGDILQQKVDCIVNAANDQLQGGAGVCGAIFKAAGWQALQEACNKYPLVNGVRCTTGTACITSSYNLKEKDILFIIHAVGPDCRKIKDEKLQNELLKGAYTSSLQLATEKGAKSIAFPFISSAIFAFPRDRAARIALESVQEFLKSRKTSLTDVRFVLFNQTDFKIFQTILNESSII
jgi:O-acetyl-ADP-ribose deacetylase